MATTPSDDSEPICHRHPLGCRSNRPQTATIQGVIDYVASLPKCAACGSTGGRSVRLQGEALYCARTDSRDGCRPTR